MHNNIIAAGSRDSPPMLATGRYAQWQSRFLRYIDTRPNGDALQNCILKGPYTLTIVTIPAIPATEDSLAVPEQTIVETTAQEIWEAIKRLQQGKSLNIQDVKTNLFWEFGQFTSHDRETIESYYTRFYKMMNEMIRINLTVLQEPLQTTTNNLENSQTPETRVWNYSNVQNDNQDWTVGNQRAVNVVGARETVGGPVVQQSGIQCFNCKEFGHYAKECRKSKRVKDSTYHKEKLLLVNQLKSGVRLQSRAIYLTGLAERMKTLMNKSWKHITVTMQKIQECFKSNIRHKR
ncbi:retrovirus-related pol polyprotein from transposon TNT 1-94 [Tanacetum coccineum]